MAFIDQLQNMNSDGTLVMSEASTYSYAQFMDDMLLIESSINDILNNYYRTINETAIENILNEDSTELAVIKKEEKESTIAKLKAAWEKIVDAFFRMLDSLYNWIYEQVILQKKFIDKHRADIMRTRVIYKNVKSSVLFADGTKIVDFVNTVSEPDIETYEKMLHPEFITPLISKSELDEFTTDGKVEPKKIYEFYKDTVLGDTRRIDIEDINSKKKELIDNIDKVYSEVKKRKAIIINTQKKTPPKDIKPEELREFQLEVMNEVLSLKAYNKVLLDYCKASVSILKKFIKSSDKAESGKKEDNSNE